MPYTVTYRVRTAAGWSNTAQVTGEIVSTDTYDNRVLVDFAADVVSYWKFENGGLDAAPGARHATFTGPAEINVPTIVDLDVGGECIAWPGTAGSYAEAAHDVAHKTPEGTIVVTFQRDATGQKSTLVAADGNAVAGGLSVEVQADGAPRCFLRRQSDGAPVILLGTAGDVALNAAYAIVFKWGAAGLSLALYDANETLVRRVTDPLTDGVTGTSPIRFGAWHSDVSHHDGPYGRVVWLNRRISDAEELQLARPRTVARADSLALVYPYTSLDNVTVSTGAALATAVAGAPAGRHVHLDTDLNGETIGLAGAGADGSPIVVRPNGAVGSRTLTNCTLNLSGSWIVLVGFVLDGTTIDWDGGHHNRITRCTFPNMDGHGVVLNSCFDGRIDHNDFGPVDTGAFVNAIRFEHDAMDNSPSRFLVDRNHFHDADAHVNGAECLRYGTGGGGTKHGVDMDTRFDYNIVDRWDADYDGTGGEIVSLKSPGFVSTGNLYTGAVEPNLRVGCRSNAGKFHSDWFEGNLWTLSLLGDNPEAIGCRFEGTVQLWVFDGDTIEPSIVDGTAPAGSYPAGRNALLRGCVMDTGNITVGRDNFNPTSPFSASDTLIEECEDELGNPLTVGNGRIVLANETNTTVTATASGPFTPAVKLTTGDVGPASFDPYHGDNGPTWGDTYDDRVLVTFGADLVSYWKFENTAIDEKGTQNAVFTGAPEFNVPTIVDLDAGGECIGWPGTTGVYAEAPHNALHKTAEGTIVVTFQVDNLASKSTLVACNLTGSVPGEFAIEVLVDGSPRAFLWTPPELDPILVDLVGNAGDVATDAAYAIVFKWGAGGLSLALWDANETLVRRVTNATTEGLASTSPIRFGVWHNGTSSPHDGPFGRVVWLNRRITDLEEEQLARPKTLVLAPVANDDTGRDVVELSSLDIDVLANDEHAAGGNVTLIGEPTGPVSAAVLPDQVTVRVTSTGGLGAYSGTYQVDTAGGLSQATYSGSVVVTPASTTLEKQLAWTNANDPAGVVAAFNQAKAWATNPANHGPDGRGVIELMQGTTYVVRAPNGVINNPAGAFDLDVDDVWIRTQGSPPLYSANQATIQMESWGTQTGVHNRAAVLFNDCDNCKLSHVKVDGNKFSIGGTAGLASRIDYRFGNNGGLVNVYFNASTNCEVDNVETFNALVDGFMIDEDSASGRTTKALLVTNCDAHHNRRQALSIIECGDTALSWDQIVFRDTIFQFTGDDAGLPGEAPGSNVDLEPNQSGDLIYGVTFERCEASDSQGSSWEAGGPLSSGGTTSSRGFVYDNQGASPQLRWNRMIDTVTRRNWGRGFHATLRLGGDYDQFHIENFVSDSNGQAKEDNNMLWEDHTNTGTGNITNMTIINTDFSNIRFTNQLASSGHSVVIWRGNNPGQTLTNQAGPSIEIRNDFPS